jgi:hypothetical protein
MYGKVQTTVNKRHFIPHCTLVMSVFSTWDLKFCYCTCVCIYVSKSLMIFCDISCDGCNIEFGKVQIAVNSHSEVHCCLYISHNNSDMSYLKSPVFLQNCGIN